MDRVKHLKLYKNVYDRIMENHATKSNGEKEVDSISKSLKTLKLDKKEANDLKRLSTTNAKSGLKQLKEPKSKSLLKTIKESKTKSLLKTPKSKKVTIAVDQNQYISPIKTRELNKYQLFLQAESAKSKYKCHSPRSRMRAIASAWNDKK